MDDVVQQLGDLGLFVVRLGSNLYADGRWVNGVGFRAAPATGVPAAGTAAGGGGEEGGEAAAAPAGPGPSVLDLDRVALCSIFRGLDCRQKCACALVCKEWRAAEYQGGGPVGHDRLHRVPDLLDDVGDEGVVVPLGNVNAKALAAVIEYCKSFPFRPHVMGNSPGCLRAGCFTQQHIATRTRRRRSTGRSRRRP